MLCFQKKYSSKTLQHELSTRTYIDQVFFLQLKHEYQFFKTFQRKVLSQHFWNIRKENRTNPVGTRRRFDVHTTSIMLKRRRMDVKTTSCAYWISTEQQNGAEYTLLIKESTKPF